MDDFGPDVKTTIMPPNMPSKYQKFFDNYYDTYINDDPELKLGWLNKMTNEDKLDFIEFWADTAKWDGIRDSDSAPVKRGVKRGGSRRKRTRRYRRTVKSRGGSKRYRKI